MSVEIRFGIAVYIILIVACAVISTFIYIKARKTPVLYSLMACHALISMWMFVAIIENMARSAEETLMIDRVGLFPIMFIGGFWLIFALYYCGLMNKQNRYIIALLLLPHFVFYFPAFTKNYFYLIIAERLMDENGWTTQWGIFFKLNYILTIVYAIIGMVFVIRKSLESDKITKPRNLLIIMAVLTVLAVNILTSKQIIKAYFDYVPVSFSVWLAFMSIAIFRLKLIDITPVAVNSIFSSMEEAILILNEKNGIVDYNKSAANEFSDILDIRNKKCITEFLKPICKHIEDADQIEQLVTTFIDNRNQFNNTRYTLFTVNRLQGGKSVKVYYSLCVKPLFDNYDNHIGSIVSIRDVSELKRRTLNHERNRLSGDLHDTLGSCIMAISANLKYAIEMFSDSEEIKSCLIQAHSAATSGILHLRRIVEDLTPLELEKYGLVWALNSLFKKLETVGVVVHFNYTGADEETVKKVKYAELIYKTCQEALNNSFYHGKAKVVFINLVFSPDEIKLYISDDGEGCSNIIKNKGLTGIKEKVRSVGGRADFGSPSDGGFNIRISLPYGHAIRPLKFRRGSVGGSYVEGIDC